MKLFKNTHRTFFEKTLKGNQGEKHPTASFLKKRENKKQKKKRSSGLARLGRPICAPFRRRMCFLTSMGVDQEVSFISASIGKFLDRGDYLEKDSMPEKLRISLNA